MTVSDGSYRLASAGLCAAFALVGAVFLLAPDAVLTLFDGWSRALGLATLDAPADPFFVALAVAYMYLVTLHAWSMYRHPHDPSAARLLIQAKLASAVLSFALCALRRPYLILLVNGVVDGSIAGLVVMLARGRAARPGAGRAA